MATGPRVRLYVYQEVRSDPKYFGLSNGGAVLYKTQKGEKMNQKFLERIDMKLAVISGFFASADAMFKTKQTRCNNVIDVSSFCTKKNIPLHDI